MPKCYLKLFQITTILNKSEKSASGDVLRAFLQLFKERYISVRGSVKC